MKSNLIRPCFWLLLASILLLAAFQSRGQNQPKTDALDLYAAMTHKTVLHGHLPRLPDSLLPKMLAGTNEATAALMEELSKLGYNLVPNGEKFVQILPVSEGTKLRSAPRFHNAGATNDVSIANQTLDFPTVDLNTFLSVYTPIIGRTVLRPATLPMAIISFRTATPLTHEELNYAMGVMLSLNGIAVMEDGTKFAWIVPASDLGLVHAHAPKPEPGAELIPPDQVPKVAVSVSVSSPTFLRMHPAESGGDGVPDAGLGDLVGFYAKISGKAAQPSGRHSTQQVLFEARTPLTKAELLYAIDSTLALNNLAIVPVDDKTIRLGWVSELHPAVKQP
jgi:hypothetical protein